MEGQAEQTAFAAAIHLVADVQKGVKEQLTILENPDDTGLFDDK
jgi:hypothetical protein